MRGLLIGRFQPFHRGHRAVLTEILKDCEEAVVAIGSAQLSHTDENPFTAGERYQMVILSLEPEERSRVFVAPVPDVNRFAIWVAHVESLTPPFDRVYSNNPQTKALFGAAGYEVRPTKEYRPNLWSGKEVRRRLLRGERWKPLVPEPVALFLEGVGAPARLREAHTHQGRSV